MSYIKLNTANDAGTVFSKHKEYLFVGVFSLAYSSAFAISQPQHLPLAYLRYIVFVLGLLAYFIFLGISRQHKVDGENKYLFILAHSFLVVYAFAISTIKGGIFYFNEDQIRYLYVLISLIYSFATYTVLTSIYENPRMWKNGFSILTAYIIILTLGALMYDGFDFSLPFSLNFETPEGEMAYYSQGFTKISAVAGIYFLVSATNSERNSFILYAISLMFFALAVFGGSRGDLVSGLLALVLFVLRRPNLKSLSLLFIGSIVVFYFVARSGIGSDIVVVNRFADLSTGNFSMRDVLIEQSVYLLESNMFCLSMGCGYNFFQLDYGYQFGLYPHNVFFEILITFGIFIGGLLIVLAILGAVHLYFKVGRNPIYYIFLIDFFSLQKSSSLVDFTSLPTVLAFAWFGTRIFVSQSKNHAAPHFARVKVAH